MSVLGYFETLHRFGLEELKRGGDLQVRNGDIAVTPDGDLQFGNTRFNALFRFVERWRLNQPTLDELFNATLSTSQRLEEIMKARKQGIGASLHLDPAAFHEETGAIVGYESGASVYAGSICVVLNTLLQRFKRDLNATENQWQSAGPQINGYSLGVIFSSAAANFRHHDEWARTKRPKPQQLSSMEVLCAILPRPITTNGIPTISTNVCREILLAISNESADHLHHLTFEYVKALSHCSRPTTIP